MLGAIKSLIRRLRQPRKIELDPSRENDDYDWRYYHLDYRQQIAEIEQTTLLRLTPGDFKLSEGVIQLREGLPALHPNHRCLYETIAGLKPRSIIEVGCGGGDHLHNLGLILPEVNRRGFDRSAEQLKFLALRSPHLKNLVSIFEVTQPLPAGFQPADVVYTQAVIMHIQAGDTHLRALSNLFRMANSCVVLMENFKRHQFVSDIRELHERGELAWAPKFQFRRYEGNPHILVVSREDLALEPLEDYRQLTDPMQWDPPAELACK